MPTASHMVLEAATAADLMAPAPKSVSRDAALADVTAMMAAKGFSAAPVIDSAGRPVGVLSRSDILVHEAESSPAGGDRTARAGDVMTPAVFSVTTRTAAAKVVEQLVQLNVHQLYVVDDHQTLVGVISAHDVLRKLHA